MEFLGIQYSTLENDDVELTQQGLIKKVITAMGLEECNPIYSPTTCQLGKVPDGKAMTDSWSYLFDISMLLYLFKT